MSLAKYDKYNPSGLDYIENNPADWNVKRLKDLKSATYSSFVDGPFGSNLKTEHFVDNGDIYVIDSGFITSGLFYIHRDFKTITNDHFQTIKRSECKEGDLIIAKIGANFGMSAILPKLDKKSLVSGNTLKLTIDKKLFFLKFIHYYFLSLKQNGQIDLLVKGSAQPALSMSTMYDLPFQIPPLLVQSTIATYLDNKTSAIDRKVSLLEQKITHYQQLRKSLINETVCRGLDKNVKLKDSGIDWIGRIPEHWVVKRGKDLFKEISKKGYPEEPLLAASQKMGVVLKSMLEQRSMEAQKDFENFKLVQVGDFVISLRSFEGGIETAYYKGIISPVYSVFSFLKKMDIDYFKHLFKSGFFILYLQSIITGIRDGQSIKFVEIQNTFFAIPPIKEQVSISNYLDEKTQKIDSIVSNIKTQIETLKELRKTLINDVVTGKIKVSS